jgi:hypothetical protein
MASKILIIPLVSCARRNRKHLYQVSDVILRENASLKHVRQGPNAQANDCLSSQHLTILQQLRTLRVP